MPVRVFGISFYLDYISVRKEHENLFSFLFLNKLLNDMLLGAERVIFGPQDDTINGKANMLKMVKACKGIGFLLTLLNFGANSRTTSQWILCSKNHDCPYDLGIYILKGNRPNICILSSD